ncbi:MAG: glycoside hydrolase N-terminal domain-containing protein [Planctomycetaceae bacterium]|nr:glycoside hydrolase family 95 protein [Planctomycetaceae bacterium]
MSTEQTTKIVLDHATPQWVEGLPMGNGDIGMMLYGGPEQLTLAFNKSDVWDYRVAPGQGLPEGLTFDEMVAIAQREDFESYNRIFKNWLAAENCSRPSMISCGQLDLSLLAGERVVQFSQELDLATATARVSSDSTEYREGRQSLSVETFVPARQGVIPVTIALSPDERKLWGKLRLWRPQSLDYDQPTAWQAGDIAGLNMTIANSVTFTLAVRVLGARGGWSLAGDEAIFAIDVCTGPVVLLATVVSSFDVPGQSTREAASDRLASHDIRSPERLAKTHRSWWGDFWSRSNIALPDARLERHWRVGLYVLGCSSRPGRKAPGLQGIWNKYNRPTWHTDYHTDMNTQMIFWPLYAANHLELTEPYYRLFAVEMRDEARRAAKEFFRRRGLYYPIAAGPHGHELAAPWAWPGAGAWIAQGFRWHWLYSRDEEFLAQAYPFLKELSLFYEDLLQKDEAGTYNLFPSYAPEMPDTRGYLMMAWGRNPTGDLAFVRILFEGLVEAAEVLGVDEADRRRWIAILDHLAPCPTDAQGRLLDLEGDRWAACRPMPVTMAPLYPGGQVGLGSSDAQRATAEEIYRAVVTRFKGAGHLMTWCAAAAAHLGLGDEAAALLTDYLDSTVLENGLHLLRSVPHYRSGDVTSGVMQIEATTALANAVNEMLLQSLDGVIRVFPAVPANWGDVSFAALRATGAFLVSARRCQGATQRVCIVSEKGGPCTLADPFGTGRAVLVSCAGEHGRDAHATGEEHGRDAHATHGRDARAMVQLAADARGCFVFPTRPGASYELTPGRD